MSQTNSALVPSALPDSGEVFIVGIGAEEGGPQALTAFFEQVPPDSGLAYVVMPHLLPGYEGEITQLLQEVAQIPVSQVKERVWVMANQVYVIPPERQLVMSDGYLAVLASARLEDQRAPLDMFLRTLADTQGSRSFAVILSGTGANGSMGLKRIKEQGGTVFVQNPREAAFPEMPRLAIATGLVDAILPVAQIPARLLAYHRNPGGVDQLPSEPEAAQLDEQQALREVFTQLRLRTGHDFSQYKRPTLLRRIDRRTKLLNLPDLPAYVLYLRENPSENQVLLKDLLISVTNFFRDPQAFTALDQEALSRLLRDRGAEDTLRIWVAGCATGEEAYSLAMLCVERIQGLADAPAVQLFATDLDEAAIAIAREGLYTLNDAADVAPERLHRFFTREGDRYRIRREIREMILFAKHNVLKDPPFSRLDIISCRNMLIYFNRSAQERAITCFHFALKPGGFLLLGLAETPDGAPDLFVPLNRETHLYQSRPVSTRYYPIPELPARLSTDMPPGPPPPTLEEGLGNGRLSLGDLHLHLLEQYAHPSLIVNEEYDILHVSARAGRYLHLAGGELSRNLLQLILPELRLALRTAFYQATQQQTPVEARNLRVQLGDQLQTLTIHVRPVLGATDPGRGFILVLFEPDNQPTTDGSSQLMVRDPVSYQLEDELIRVKAQLRAASEQHEIQAEELKASNEELQAINEELRAAAEELETSKEELQSINEELLTVNQELKIKVEEVSVTGNNLQNLINSTDLATLFLDRGLRVNLFTPATQTIFNLIPADLGRPLSDITNRLDYPHLLTDAEGVLTSLQPLEREVRTRDGNLFMMRVLPYRTAEDHINGVVFTFVNITEYRAAQEVKYFLASVVESSQDSIMTTNFDGIITSWNRAAEALYGYSAGEVIGQPVTMLTLPQDLAQALGNIDKIQQAQQVAIFETERLSKAGRKISLELVLSPVNDERGRVIGVSTVGREITSRKQAEREASLKNLTLRHQTESLTRAGSWEYNQQSGHFSWSEGMYQLFGLVDNQPITLDIFPALALKADQAVAQRLLEQFQHSDEPFEEVLRIQVDAQVRTLKITGVSLPGENAASGRLLGIAWDITEQVLAQEQSRQSAESLQAVLNASPASIGLLKAVHDATDPNLIVDFRLVVGNTKIAQFFDQPLEQLLGQSAAQFSSLLWDGQTLELLRQVYESNQPRYDEKCLATAPHERWVGVAVSRQDDGLVVTGLDITELKQTQGQQQYWLAALEQASQSAHRLTQLRDSLQQRGELLRSASHDLRGQVGVIATAAQLLGLANNEANRSKMIEMIQRNIRQMVQLMTNLLDFSRLEAGRETAQLARFDVAELLEELVKNAQPLAQERGLWLKTDGLAKLEVESDVVQVRRMVQNLLFNALTYTQAGGVTVSWQPLADSAGWQFSIGDTGPGLSPQLLDRLQGKLPASQAGGPVNDEPLVLQPKGEGIGLSIVKQLCTLLGGRLLVESTPAVGTLFVVRFEIGPTASI
ncbi:CheR family methyltransferase [Fibrella forsythiae]|uniref:histidine kinase n=1 Tax=Fibrella forsythiae TaxID=2817061 RepID=A0ABS3JSJ1_9BACT|nr:CheR family methyltransferase [Fibrella forsythiae]MBO0952943.1 PAS domain S-box protein [Fibrella forsythiae]